MEYQRPLIKQQNREQRIETWVFGSASGRLYNDNSRHFFEYIERNHCINAVWLTKNDEVVRFLRNRGRHCYKYNSLEGLYYSLFSRVNIISYGYEDLPLSAYIFNKNKIIVHLWHGIPIKRIDKLRKTVLSKILRKLLTAYLGRQFDLFITTTKKTNEIFKKAFGLSDDVILDAGYPRIDHLILNKRMEEKQMKKRFGHRKVIFFLPTFREFENTLQLYFSNEKNLKKLDDFLGKENFIMLIKLHISNNREMNTSIFEPYKNIMAVENKPTYDLYSELAGADLLVTDFSGVAFEFAALGKPVIFVGFNKENYLLKERGTYLSLKELSSRNFAENWVQFMKILEKKDWKNRNLEKVSKEYIGSVFGKSCKKIEDALLNYKKTR